MNAVRVSPGGAFAASVGPFDPDRDRQACRTLGPEDVWVGTMQRREGIGGSIMTTDQEIRAPEHGQKQGPGKWPWIVGIVAALIAGVGIGVAGTSGDTEPTATTDNSAEIQELQDQIADVEAERDEALDELAALTEEEPAEEPEPEPVEASALEIGDTAVISWGSGDTGNITVSNLETTTTPYDEYGEGPKNDQFLIFTVDLKADADQFDVDEYEFYVVIDGTRYDEGEGNSIDAADYDDQLGYVVLNAGESKSGVLVFDVPEGKGELFYAPNFEGGAIASWKF